MLSNQEVVESLRWKKFPVLSDGFVTLVDVMGDDNAIAQAARTSFGNDNPKIECTAIGCDEGVTGAIATGVQYLDGLIINDDVQVVNCKVCNGFGFVDRKGKPWKENDQKADKSLIRMLMRHRHSTPLEMCEVKLLIRIPMDAHRQLIRHRTANVNEYSTRYADAIDSMDKTPVDQWRLQSESNRQGSSGYLIPLGDDTGIAENLTRLESEFHVKATKLYEHRLNCGIAREQARKDLPLSNYTELYWKCDLHNIFHFLGLRMDSHAQKEIRDYATIIGEQIIKPLFPIAWEAFEQYRLNALNLTQLDVEVIAEINRQTISRKCPLPWRDKVEFGFASTIWPEEWQVEKCRERDECIAKLKRLGLVTE